MKKIISLLLAVLMALTAFSVSAFAAPKLQVDGKDAASIPADTTKDAFLVTENGSTRLIGDTTLRRWVGNWENWRNWTRPSDEMKQRYPYIDKAWEDASSTGSLKLSPDALKLFWHSFTNTDTLENRTPVDAMKVYQDTDGKYKLQWIAADKSILAEDSYTMTGKVLNGLEGATMYVFTADTMKSGSPFKYWVTMAPDYETEGEYPIAGHFHFQYGSSLKRILPFGQLYTGSQRNLFKPFWYATMINANESDTAKYNVILALHKADKWREGTTSAK